MSKDPRQDSVQAHRKTLDPVVKVDLTGKVVVVVGANTGLGFEASKHLATMNPLKLVLACRSKEKGERALADLKAQTKFCRAELRLLDLNNFSSIKSFVEAFEKENGRLDILLANAAVALDTQYILSDEGYEMTLQTNHLGTSLLSLLLLPLMFKTAKNFYTLPRLVVVSSGVHSWVTIDKALITDKPGRILQALSDKAYYRTEKDLKDRYPISKLLNIFFVRSLNNVLPTGSPTILVNAISPGLCDTELRRNLTGDARQQLDSLVEREAYTSEEGSRSLVYGAVGEEGKEEKLKGQYLSLSEIKEVSDYVLGEDGQKAQELIWDETIEILSGIDPRVKSIVQEYLSH